MGNRYSYDQDPGNISLTDNGDEKTSKSWVTKWRTLLTVISFWLVFVCVGLSCGLTGPAFLDLLMITDESIDTGSVIFTFASVGILCGNLLAGISMEKVDIKILLAAATVGSSILQAAIPWCEDLPLMTAVQAAQRTCVGIIETSLHFMCVQLWGTEIGPPVQVLHFGFAFGGILGPLITEPFLGSNSEESNLVRNSSGKQESANNMPFGTAIFCKNIAHYKMSTLVNLTNNNGTGDMHSNYETCVPMAYFIVAFVTLLTALPFVIMFCYDQETTHDKPNKDNKTDESTWSKRVEITMLVFLAAFFALYACIEISFANYLATFVVENLNWSRTNSARLTSVFWACLAVGRFLGIGLTVFLSAWKMLAFDLFFLNLSFLGLLLGNGRWETSVWLCTALAGLSLASIFATAFTWVNDRIMILTSRMTTFLLTFATAGALLNPILLGYLFERFSPMWFVYLLFGKIIICTVIFIIISCIVKVCRLHRDC